MRSGPQAQSGTQTYDQASAPFKQVGWRHCQHGSLKHKTSNKQESINWQQPWPEYLAILGQRSFLAISISQWQHASVPTKTPVKTNALRRFKLSQERQISLATCDGSSALCCKNVTRASSWNALSQVHSRDVQGETMPYHWYELLHMNNDKKNTSKFLIFLGRAAASVGTDARGESCLHHC